MPASARRGRLRTRRRRVLEYRHRLGGRLVQLTARVRGSAPASRTRRLPSGVSSAANGSRGSAAGSTYASMGGAGSTKTGSLTSVSTSTSSKSPAARSSPLPHGRASQVRTACPDSGERFRTSSAGGPWLCQQPSPALRLPPRVPQVTLRHGDQCLLGAGLLFLFPDRLLDRGRRRALVRHGGLDEFDRLREVFGLDELVGLQEPRVLDGCSSSTGPVSSTGSSTSTGPGSSTGSSTSAGPGSSTGSSTSAVLGARRLLDLDGLSGLQSSNGSTAPMTSSDSTGAGGSNSAPTISSKTAMSSGPGVIGAPERNSGTSTGATARRYRTLMRAQAPQTQLGLSSRLDHRLLDQWLRGQDLDRPA